MKISDDLLYRYASEARDAWLDTGPQSQDVPVHPFSRRFQKKMKKLLAEQRRSPRVNALIGGARRAAVVAIVLLGVTFSGLMTVQAYREKIIQVVTQVFEELTRFRFSSDEGTASSALPVFLPATIEYLPEGMQEVEREQMGPQLYIHFEDPTSGMLDLTQTQITDALQLDMILDTEDASAEHFTIQGEEAKGSSKNGIQSIVFTKHSYVFTLYSTLPMSELKQVAEQIKIK